MSVQTIRERICTEVEYDGANLSCVRTDEGLVLIDTPMLPQDVNGWKTFLSGLGGSGVQYIVNTDHHFDHVLGNRTIGGTVVMHEAARAEMLKPGMTLRESMAGMTPGRTQEEIDFMVSEPLIPAQITFTDELTLHLAGCTLQLLHTPGHTAGTICAYLVEDRVLFTGDTVVYGAHPYKGQAHFRAWLESLKKLEELPVEVVVPGHGEVCDGAGLAESIEYFERLIGITADLLKKGALRDETVAKVRAELFDCYAVEPELRDGAVSFFDEGTARLYDELKSAK